MWEAFVSLVVLSRWWFGMPNHLTLGFATMATGWVAHWLPSSVYPLQSVAVSTLGREVGALTITVDALQFGVHWWMHALRMRSHARHHIHKTPRVQDAFDTGAVDGVLQLIVPIYVAMWMWRPSRVSASAFGVLYGLWLQWIHSDDPNSLSCTSTVFVTPAYHRIHHLHANVNFGHVLRVWDRVCDTQADPTLTPWMRKRGAR